MSGVWRNDEAGESVARQIGPISPVQMYLRHCEDLKDNKPSPRDNAQERLALEGFQELP